MSIRTIFTLGLIATIWAGTALAHSPVKTTSPSNEEVLTSEPEMLHMIFAAPARVMKVVMIHSTADASHETRLEIPSRDFVTELHLTPEFSGAGDYAVQWRALGEDGHVLKGEFSFEISGD